MNKEALIRKYKEITGASLKDSKIAVDGVIEAIINGMAEAGEVKITGFGTFSLVEKEESQARNPKTGESVTVPAHKSPKFKFSKTLKDLMR